LEQRVEFDAKVIELLVSKEHMNSAASLPLTVVIMTHAAGLMIVLPRAAHVEYKGMHLF
jgi:hypothetical protein